MELFFILIMDTFNAHIGIDRKNVCRDRGIPKKLFVIFLITNITSCYQPTDMGIIAYLKFGYLVQLINNILCLFDLE